ncbi:MAG: DUF3883 domain-containing protein [Sediminicola sp.]
MNLQSFIKNLQLERLGDSDAALKNIANSERYLQQAYEGRYLFELIQNVRDANKQVEMSGSVLIELTDGRLTISNTGSPFNESGINSITTIGDSPKESQEFIGFKGIGFKSVHEVSDTPHVITKWGTVVFDKERSKKLLMNRNLNDRDIPLFFLPHYHEEGLSIEEISEGIVTKVVLPLKSEIKATEIKTGFNEIGIHQFVLLGNLRNIEFRDADNHFQFSISEERSGKVIIAKNGDGFAFKHFKPTVKVLIPPAIIETLEDKERVIYEKDPFVDISLLFDLDENGYLCSNPHSKLYLFYQTEITSGFNFIIHSYFIVSPDRKGLRVSQLNRFILEQIAVYLTGEWLSIVKRNHSSTFLDFLVFTRNPDAPILSHLYDALVKHLKELKFLFDKQTKKFYNVREVIIADGFDKGLFPDHQLNGKRLIYIQQKNTIGWLLAEFDVDYLSYETIAENIEKECVRQRNQKNLKFFENLYRYLVEYDDLNLKDKKVLLTSKLRLLSSQDYVFYGLKDKMQFPASIEKRINFIHPAVKISDHRQGRGQTGFVEFKTESLVTRLLRLYDDPKVSKMDILISLLKLNITDKLYAEIRPRILMPMKGGQWLNAFTTAIYLETDELIRLYSPEKFINLHEFEKYGIPDVELHFKLKQLGAWDIPGLYFSSKSITVKSDDERFDYIRSNIRSYSTPYFVIYGDWLFDVPLQVTKWFSESLIANWAIYNSRILDENNAPISYKSQSSDKYDIKREHYLHLSGALKYLRNERWIKIEGQDQVFHMREVVGIDPIESLQVNSLLFKKYLYCLEIHYASNQHLIQLLDLSHLDGQSFLSFQKILQNIFVRYHNIQGPDKEFLTFYNKVLSKLFDYYFFCDTKEKTTELANCQWLGINEISQTFDWKLAKQLYYIDDKPAYELLPQDIKALVQPHFTNRDKNRFGQIGKRIGLNFKQTIEQRLVNIIAEKKAFIWNWMPAFAESIALVEILLETNLDTKLDELRTIKIIICESFEIELYKDGQCVSTIRQLSHKIEREDQIYNVYVSQRGCAHQHSFASILHDLLSEVLSRDMHTVRLTLNDFYTRESKKKFIERYEVSQDRVDDIGARLKGFSVTKVQSFWLAILRLKCVDDPKSFLSGDTVNFEMLLLKLDIEEDVGITKIMYDHIDRIENLIYLQSLFAALQIDIKKFNNVSDIKIDYRNYFVKQVEGLRFSYKKNMEVALYDYLMDKTIDVKASFQDQIDAYTSMSDISIPAPLLDFDIHKYFTNQLKQAYPHIVISQENVEIRKAGLLSQYHTNEKTFRRWAKTINGDNRILAEFLELNHNRSLLYFNGTSSELEQRFLVLDSKKSGNNPNNNSDLKQQLHQYSSLPGTAVEETDTLAIPLSIKEENNGGYGGGGNGRRVDGGILNGNTAFSGIVAEKVVYEQLLQTFSEAEWVSRNAAKAGFNPEGSDQYGCDIKYIGRDGQPHYVEVKSSISDERHFFITYSEYVKAINEKNNYHFYMVLFSLDNTKRRILHLGNIFMLDDGQELFGNDYFTANFKDLEIRFQ